MKIFYFLPVILIYSCTGSESEPVRVDVKKDITAIKEIVDSYQNKVNNENAEAYVQNFTDDVFRAPLNNPVARNKMEIKNGILDSFSRSKYDLQEE